VFGEMIKSKNINEICIVCQIDLSNAYNNVNLRLLEERIENEGIWS